MPVDGLDLATLDLQRADNVRRTASPVRLLGFVRDGVLVIDDAALAADGGAQPLARDNSKDHSPSPTCDGPRVPPVW